jgi:ribonuclease J
VRARIHRGTQEIGGNCVEVEAGDSRIVLDVGRPLDALRDDVISLPEIAGFGSADPSLLGLIISHGHQDHWGLIAQVPKDVSVYIGEAAYRILEEAAFFSIGAALAPAGFLRHREPFSLGPFLITPFLNDHSGFDTYSLLIESEGRRLFYSADLQAHGRKAGIFDGFVRKPPAGVDVLMMEGTNLRQQGDPKTGKTEIEIEKDFDSHVQGHTRHRPRDVFRSEHRPASHDVSSMHPIRAASGS